MLKIAGKYKKGHSKKGHEEEKKGEENEKKTKFFDEDGDEGFDEKKGINLFRFCFDKMCVIN